MIITAPAFGNSWALDFKVLQRESIGGQLHTARDTEWPVIERMSFEFPGLSLSQKNTFVTDLKAAYGTQITLTDFEGSDWIGTVVESVEESEEYRACGYNVRFEFEGILQP